MHKGEAKSPPFILQIITQCYKRNIKTTSDPFHQDSIKRRASKTTMTWVQNYPSIYLQSCNIPSLKVGIRSVKVFNFDLINLFFSTARKSLVTFCTSASAQSSLDQLTRNVSLPKLLSSKLDWRTTIPRRTSVSVVPSNWRTFHDQNWRFVYWEMNLIVMKLKLTIFHTWMLNPWRNSTKTRNLLKS